MSKAWAVLELGTLGAAHIPRAILCPELGAPLKGVPLAWPMCTEGQEAWSLGKLGWLHEGRRGTM